MVEIAFLAEAEEDYQVALAWYEARSRQAAAGFEAAVEVALQAIAAKPGMWTSCDDHHRFYVLRRYPFSIIYREETDRILIVAFSHSSQAPAGWQHRR